MSCAMQQAFYDKLSCSEKNVCKHVATKMARLTTQSVSAQSLMMHELTAAKVAEFPWYDTCMHVLKKLLVLTTQSSSAESPVMQGLCLLSTDAAAMTAEAP